MSARARGFGSSCNNITAPPRSRYSLHVISLWVSVAVAALLGVALIGALVSLRSARKENPVLIKSIRHAQRQEARAATYLEVAIAWHMYLQTVRTLAYPEETFPANRPRDLALVLRSRAQLELHGTPTVRQLHDEALEAAVTLINVLRSMPRSASSGEPNIAASRRALRPVLDEIAYRVDVLEQRMMREVRPRSIVEQHVEITGRARQPQPRPAQAATPVPPEKRP